jgi:hypothetical protein
LVEDLRILGVDKCRYSSCAFADARERIRAGGSVQNCEEISFAAVNFSAHNRLAVAIFRCAPAGLHMDLFHVKNTEMTMATPIPA